MSRRPSSTFGIVAATAASSAGSAQAMRAAQAMASRQAVVQSLAGCGMVIGPRCSNDERPAAYCTPRRLLESQMILRILSVVLGLAGLAWLALLFSSRAILVSEKVEQGTLRQKLVCTYFAGS